MHASGRLIAVVLTLAATIPGPLELAHEHDGGTRAHVHPRHEIAPRDHAHPHGSDHHSHDHEHGAALEAADTSHVHALSPFQRVAQSALLLVATAPEPPRRAIGAPPRTLRGVHLVSRSRGPPSPVG